MKNKCANICDSFNITYSIICDEWLSLCTLRTHASTHIQTKKKIFCFQFGQRSSTELPQTRIHSSFKQCFHIFKKPNPKNPNFSSRRTPYQILIVFCASMNHFQSIKFYRSAFNSRGTTKANLPYSRANVKNGNFHWMEQIPRHLILNCWRLVEKTL